MKYEKKYVLIPIEKKVNTSENMVDEVLVTVNTASVTFNVIDPLEENVGMAVHYHRTQHLSWVMPQEHTGTLEDFIEEKLKAETGILITI